MKMLKVSDDRRYVVHEDGSPFFWLGDTAWELFHKLTREEAVLYLANRAHLKFNVIQAVALAEHEGVTSGNAYGRLPLKMNASGVPDPTMPDLDGEYSYWQHMDFIIDAASERGMYIALLPTWGDKIHLAWGKGPEIFNARNARQYGRWIGERYRDQSNIIWVLGGDRPLTKKRHMDVISHMAEGIREGDGGRHLMTFHPVGNSSSSYHVHEEPWLDFNMIQSGHDDRLQDNHKRVLADYTLQPVKPTLDGEPCYEDHPRGFKSENGYFDQADVRQAAYYAVFSGAFGHTYGHHSIWSMTTQPTDYYPMTWKDALERPGAAQMQHLRDLMESRTTDGRVPDPSLLAHNYPGANHMPALRGIDHAMIYSPNGVPFQAVLGKLQGLLVRVAWYNPRTGKFSRSEDIPNAGERWFYPPASGRGSDWVLVMDRTY